MALHTTGSISLNQIHIEAGGASGSTAGLNDADIRGLIGKSSGASMSFNEWYGASSVEEQTVTVGIKPAAQYSNPVYGFAVNDFGSTSDGTFNIKSANVRSLNWAVTIIGNNAVRNTFHIEGIHTNSGFTTMTIKNGNTTTGTFQRSAATFSTLAATSTTPAITIWTWEGTNSTAMPNPYGTTSGATRTVTWT